MPIFNGSGGGGAINSGSGIPPSDMQSLSMTSGENGITVTFKGPANSYLHGYAANTETLACVPAGVMIRYSDTDYPKTPDEGVLAIDYHDGYNPTNPAEQSVEVVGLTKDETYYFSAFPYSNYGIYNMSQNAKNRGSCQWVGNAGTIKVNVGVTPTSATSDLGEYTVTLVSQDSGGSNIQKQATGAGETIFSGLLQGTKWKVQLSTPTDFIAPALSEEITIEVGQTYTVNMTYTSKWGSITVNVTATQNPGSVGAYTVTLISQDGGSNVTKQGSGANSYVFNNLEHGKKYVASVSAVSGYSTPGNSAVLTVVGGGNVSTTMTYSLNNATIAVTVNTNKNISGFSLGGYTITLVSQDGGSNQSQSVSGTGTFNFYNLPVGRTYRVRLSSATNWSAPGQSGVLITVAGQTVSTSMTYSLNVSLASCSWTQIKSIGDSGQASQVFDVGETKIDGSRTCRLVGFNQDWTDRNGTTKAPMSFVFENLFDIWESNDYSDWRRDYGTTIYNGCSTELKGVMQRFYKNYSNTGRIQPLTGYVLAIRFGDLFGASGGLGSWWSVPGQVENGYGPCPYTWFSSSSRRAKGEQYDTGSSVIPSAGNIHFAGVDSDGTPTTGSGTSWDIDYPSMFCFCI